MGFTSNFSCQFWRVLFDLRSYWFSKSSRPTVPKVLFSWIHMPRYKARTTMYSLFGIGSVWNDEDVPLPICVDPILQFTSCRRSVFSCQKRDHVRTRAFTSQPLWSSTLPYQLQRISFLTMDPVMLSKILFLLRQWTSAVAQSSRACGKFTDPNYDNGQRFRETRTWSLE